MKDLSKISIGCVVEQNSCLPRRNYFCVVTYICLLVAPLLTWRSDVPASSQAELNHQHYRKCAHIGYHRPDSTCGVSPTQAHCDSAVIPV